MRFLAASYTRRIVEFFFTIIFISLSFGVLKLKNQTTFSAVGTYLFTYNIFYGTRRPTSAVAGQKLHLYVTRRLLPYPKTAKGPRVGIQQKCPQFNTLYCTGNIKVKYFFFFFMFLFRRCPFAIKLLQIILQKVHVCYIRIRHL